MSYYEKKPGHPILAIVLGIIGILVALFLTLIAGVAAGAVAGILGIAALAIGLSGRSKGGSGIGGIIAGVLAIILAVVMTVSTINAFTRIQKEAEKYVDEAPLVAKTLDKPALGLLGMILNLPKDEGSAEEVMRQFQLVEDKMKAATDGATAAPTEAAATEAPAEETPAEENTTEEAPKAND